MPHHEHTDAQAGPLLVTSVIPADDPDRIEVQLIGELDSSNAAPLEAVLDGLIRAGHRRIAVDLAELRFLGCTGLSVFVRAHDTACAAGAQVHFTRPTSMTTRILRITGLDLVLVVRTDRDPAAGRPAPSSASCGAV